MQTSIPYFNAVGRILIAAIFLLSGVSKISGYEATQGYMAAIRMRPLREGFDCSARRTRCRH